MVYRVKHGSVWTDQLPRLWVLELVALEMLAGMKPTEMKLSPIQEKFKRTFAATGVKTLYAAIEVCASAEIRSIRNLNLNFA